MGRKPGKPNICAVCGEKSQGTNFKVPTCTPCKVFFRRNALRNENEITCKFDGKCGIDNNTRKFCPKCRLQKCLDVGMKREMIFTEEKRRAWKEKFEQNKLLKHQKENSDSGRQDSLTLEKSTSNSDYTKSTPILNPQDEIELDILDSLELNSTFDENHLESIIFELSLLGNNSESVQREFTNSTESSQNHQLVSFDYSNNNSQSQSFPHTFLLEFKPEFYDTEYPVSPSYFELGLPERELISPEKFALIELQNAGISLQNSYKQIEYYELLDPDYCGRMTESIFYRLIRMCKRMSSFVALEPVIQGKMLKCSLLKLLHLRSVLMHNRDREMWSFVDDNHRTNILFRVDYLKPLCVKCDFERHRNLPFLFRDEWKSDGIIFDLLSAIVLFTPMQEYSGNFEQIKQEHERFTRLLLRYLRIKYPTVGEADECFNALLSNLNEMYQLNEDILYFFRYYSDKFKKNPFYMELLGLNDENNSSTFGDCSISSETLTNRITDFVDTNSNNLSDNLEFWL